MLEMKFEDVVRDVAKELKIDQLLDTPEGRAFIARSINGSIKMLEEKFSSQIAEERKLRTAAEEATAELMAKMGRQRTYDADYGFHRGIDGKSIQPNVSRDTAEKLVKLLRGFKNGDMDAVRAVSSGVGGEGGYMLQDEVANDILRLIPETSVYPRLARPWPMGSKKINIGDVLSQMGAYWPDENTAITESFPLFGKVPLEAKLLGALIPVPLSLIEDATPELGQLFADLVRECIGKEIDRVGIAGKTALNGGTDVFDGLLYAPNINPVVMATGQTSMKGFRTDYLLDLQDTAPEGARDGCSYLLSQSVFNYARKQKDSDGNPIWQRPADGEPGTIFGKPYTLSERMPHYSAAAAPSKRFVAYGNFKKWAIFGTRKELSIATSDVAGDAFKNNQLIIRGLTRIGVAAFGQALAELETAAT